MSWFGDKESRGQGDGGGEGGDGGGAGGGRKMPGRTELVSISQAVVIGR